MKFFMRAPRLLTPLFLVSSLRMYREIAAANRGFARGVLAALRYGGRVIAHMFVAAPNGTTGANAGLRELRRRNLPASRHQLLSLPEIRPWIGWCR